MRFVQRQVRAVYKNLPFQGGFFKDLPPVSLH
jgi:hypothetical protein